MSKSEERREAIQRESEETKKARQMVEEIACNIAKLSRQVAALLDSRLKRKTIIILLASSARLPQEVIDRVLTAIENLEKNHLK